MPNGKFIVLYGVNNLGKSTQAGLLVEKITQENKNAVHVKYPIYDIKPTGLLLNEYLRKGNPKGLTPREAQIIYAYNREQFEEKIKDYQNQGVHIIAEDYWGTGVAWGIGQGVDQKFLLEINADFQHEDIAILLYGKRFIDAREKSHLHETNDDLTNKVADAHEELANQFGWSRVHANQTIEKVHQDIWKIVKKAL